MSITLSRLGLIGHIGNDTPGVVVREIAAAHGINYDNSRTDYLYHCQMIKQILRTKVPAIKLPYDRSDLIKIACFISPHISINTWPEINPRIKSEYTLLQAFNRYLGFRNKQYEFSLHIQYGEMSSSDIYLYDACLLYKYCHMRQLRMSWKTTINDMINIIMIDINADLYSIKRKIVKLLNRDDLSKRSLINAMNSLSDGLTIQDLNSPLYPQHRNVELISKSPYKPYQPLLGAISPIELLSMKKKLDDSIVGMVETNEQHILKSFANSNNQVISIKHNNSNNQSIDTEKDVNTKLNNIINSNNIIDSYNYTISQNNTNIQESKQIPDVISRKTSQVKSLTCHNIPNIKQYSTNNKKHDVSKERMFSNKNSNVNTMDIRSKSTGVKYQDRNHYLLETILYGHQFKPETDIILEKPKTILVPNSPEEIIITDFGNQEICKISDDIPVEYIDDVQIEYLNEITENIQTININDLMEDISSIISEYKILLNSQQQIDSNYMTNLTRRLAGLSVNNNDHYLQIHKKLRDVKVIDHGTAVIYIACNYLFDISNTESPLAEYRNIIKYGGIINNYKPLSKTLAQRMDNRRKYVDGPMLSTVFNPYLPIELYHPDTLISLAKYYGIDENNGPQNTYGKLQETILLDNFYPGIAIIEQRVDAQEETLITYEDLIDLNPSEAVSYGNRLNGYVVITYDELTNMFEREGYFRMITNEPDNVNQYNQAEIDHLIIITMRNFYDNEPNDIKQIKRRLITTANNIRVSGSNMSQSEIRLVGFYRKVENKSSIDMILECFLDLTMRMRGWDGKSSYPVGYNIKTDATLVNINVSTSFARYNKCCKDNKEASAIFEKLPLYRYNKQHKMYIRSNQMEDGLTIEDRLKIVLQGETTSNINSCIRVTSNWFVATYCHIMKMLGKIVSFNLEELRTIA